MRNNPRIWFRANVSGRHGPPGVECVQVGSRIVTLASEPSAESYPIFAVNENVVAAPLAMTSQDLSQKLSSHVRTDIANVSSGARLRSVLRLASLPSAIDKPVYPCRRPLKEARAPEILPRVEKIPRDLASPWLEPANVLQRDGDVG